MALFVPALRLAMLFLNVYDSYKTLKSPPPSTRDPTRPSIRATTQRKRDMKGCLAVWVVWCCFTSYERMVESLISIFIPFYDEFKSMFILFLIFTRARGAEPIFLHIVRPIVKPYTTTLDGTFDVLRMVGDFLFALAMYPIYMARAWWHRRFNPQVETSDSDSETTTSSQSTTTENTTNSAAQHNIWVPPASAYNEELGDEVDAPPEFVDLTPEEKAVDEWRQYPAFPSAYPTSPLLTSSFFPPTTSFAGAMQMHDGMPSYAPSAPLSNGEGFPKSLQSSRKAQNPSYAGGSSDRTRQPSGFATPPNARSTAMNGLSQVYSDDEQHGDSMDEDDRHNNLFSGSEIGSDDEEDSFNMTLRTPLPPHGAARSRALMERLTIPLPLGSANSMNSQSTNIPSARTTASTFRTWSSRGSDPDSLEPSPVDGSAMLSASSATLVADAGLGLMMGEDRVKTLVQPQERGQQVAKKRKAVNGAGLQDLTETSDTADDDEKDADMDDDEEEDEDGQAEDGEEEDVFVPSEQQEMKRRKIVRKGASTTSLKPSTQTQNGVRRPLSMRSSQGQIGSTGTSSASQQAAKLQTKSISAVKANANPMAPKTGPTSSASVAKRTSIPAMRSARGGAKPTTNTARTAASSAVKAKVGSAPGVKRSTSSASSSTATLSAPQIGRTVSSGSNASNGSSLTGTTS